MWLTDCQRHSHYLKLAMHSDGTTVNVDLSSVIITHYALMLLFLFTDIIVCDIQMLISGV